MPKYILYHYPLCPISRKVRVVLNEFKIKYKMEEERFWDGNKNLVSLNVIDNVPVLYDKKQDYPICDSYVITEYLNTHYNEGQIIFWGEDELETKRLVMWFDKRFNLEVSRYILEEKVYSTYQNKKIDSKRLNIGQKNLLKHLDYMEFLLENREWLAGNEYSIADISASTQISTLDYLGEIRWNKYHRIKEWYMIIKSKTSFDNILQDDIKIIKPSRYYKIIDL